MPDNVGKKDIKVEMSTKISEDSADEDFFRTTSSSLKRLEQMTKGLPKIVADEKGEYVPAKKSGKDKK